ncbi:hypothetical protein [Cryobacterium sp. Y57]|uniref:hypothetical protein n=1 Tax=Cryobacterium sp. Y57 TaxID=2048287 RepID=UPI0013050460|nr:hypothetical protein [Cryobacterium sp. Y57]
MAGHVRSERSNNIARRALSSQDIVQIAQALVSSEVATTRGSADASESRQDRG